MLWAARGQQQGPRKISPKQVEGHSKKDGGFPKTNFGSRLNNVLGQLVYEIPFDNNEMYLHLIAEFGHKKMWAQKSSDSFYNTNCIDWKCKWQTCERWLLKDDFLKLWTFEKKSIFLKNSQLLEGSPEKDLDAIRKDSEVTSNSKFRPNYST